MKRLMRGLVLGVLSGALALGLTGFTSMAATKTTINRVSISFDSSDIEIGSYARTAMAEAVGDDYYVLNDTATATNMSSNQWSSGVTPKLKLTIKAESDYKFDTSLIRKSDYYSFSGSSVSFVSASGSSSSITLTVKLPKLKGNKDDLSISGANWIDNSTRGEWDNADYAEKYYVKLYRGSTLIMNSETTGTSYDFSGYINSTGTYSFRVRSYAYGTYGNWITSDELDVDNYNLSSYTRNPGTGQWMRNHIGWWYQYPNGSYPYHTWQYINNKWYYFDRSGYMLTGWIETNGVWYYCGPDGDMYVSRWTPDGYWVDANGAWVPR